MKPCKRNCKGWDRLTDAGKDPDSNRITKQEYEEALAEAKAQHLKSVDGTGLWETCMGTNL